MVTKMMIMIIIQMTITFDMNNAITILKEQITMELMMIIEEKRITTTGSLV